MTRAKHQIKTRTISLEKIMRTAAFRRGVADVRNGHKPRFDSETDGPWFYDWGRQFGVLAPHDLEIVLPIKKQLNPKAVEFFSLHNGDICE